MRLRLYNDRFSQSYCLFIDDYSKSMEESIKMLQFAQDQGFIFINTVH